MPDRALPAVTQSGSSAERTDDVKILWVGESLDRPTAECIVGIHRSGVDIDVITGPACPKLSYLLNQFEVSSLTFCRGNISPLSDTLLAQTELVSWPLHGRLIPPWLTKPLPNLCIAQRDTPPSPQTRRGPS